VLPGGEALIIAGDSCEAKEYVKPTLRPADAAPNYMHTNRDRINGFFIDECEKKYEHVFIIAGNHEHYHSKFHKTVPKMRDNLPESFHVMDNDCVILEDVMFLGGTLWTDCNRQDPLTMHGIRDMMNDFHSITMKRSETDYNKFRPMDSLKEHIKTLQFFKLMMEEPAHKGKKVVVMTHHAPTAMSVNSKYAGQFIMNGAYHSRLDDFILDRPQIKLWCHGHMHDKSDYMVGDDCRVICNPRGYQTRAFAEESGFDPTFVVEV
jgi:DNA repair exonuclease SbcCD nuclease subunit